MTPQQIIQLLKDKREEVRDIEGIPADLPSSEKALKVEARQQLSITLGHIIDLIEGKPSTGEKKNKYKQLLP